MNLRAFVLLTISCLILFGFCLLENCFCVKRKRWRERRVDVRERRGEGSSDEEREGKLWSGGIAWRKNPFSVKNLNIATALDYQIFCLFTKHIQYDILECFMLHFLMCFTNQVSCYIFFKEDEFIVLMFKINGEGHMNEARSFKNTTRRLTQSPNLDSQRLTHRPKTRQGLELGTLHIYSRCAILFSCVLT